MGRFTKRLQLAAGLAAFGVLAAAAQFLDHGPGRVTALALAGGLFTVALAVVVRDRPIYRHSADAFFAGADCPSCYRARPKQTSLSCGARGMRAWRNW